MYFNRFHIYASIKNKLKKYYFNIFINKNTLKNNIFLAILASGFQIAYVLMTNYNTVKLRLIMIKDKFRALSWWGHRTRLEFRYL
jgi:hypothetical protein